MTPEAVWRVHVDAIDVLPGAEWIDREDWVQLRTPSSPHAQHNRILRARLRPDEADERIAAVIADHRHRDAGLSWLVDAGSAPADLSERLQAAGVDRIASARGMVRAVAGDPLPPFADGVRVVAATRDDASLLAEISMEGWGRDEQHGEAMVAWVERTFDRPDPDLEFTFVMLDDEAVGYAVLHVIGNAGYMQGACVLPPARGRGLYTALTHARLARLHERGVAHAVIWADEATSAPTAARLGFEDVTTGVFHELV